MTLGKTVTLHKGVVVTDIGPGIVIKGGVERIDENVRRVATTDGKIWFSPILRSVIEALPETIRRDSFGYRP